MRLGKRKPSGREKDQESIKRLEQLRHTLHQGKSASIRRVAAFQLAWMQEDGLDILKEALFEQTPKTTKTAAAYGLRKTHGRIKKMALSLLQEGLEHDDPLVAEVCRHCVQVLSRPPGKAKSKTNRKSAKERPRQQRQGRPRRKSRRIQPAPGPEQRPLPFRELTARSRRSRY